MSDRVEIVLEIPVASVVHALSQSFYLQMEGMALGKAEVGLFLAMILKNFEIIEGNKWDHQGIFHAVWTPKHPTAVKFRRV
jgi:hypothetical protein